MKTKDPQIKKLELEVKLQHGVVTELCGEIQLEIKRISFKSYNGSWHRKKTLEKRYAALKGLESTLASIRMIGVEKILSLPILVTEVKNLLPMISVKQNAAVNVYDTKLKIENLIKKF